MTDRLPLEEERRRLLRPHGVQPRNVVCGHPAQCERSGPVHNRSDVASLDPRGRRLVDRVDIPGERVDGDGGRHRGIVGLTEAGGRTDPLEAEAFAPRVDPGRVAGEDRTDREVRVIRGVEQQVGDRRSPGPGRVPPSIWRDDGRDRSFEASANRVVFTEDPVAEFHGSECRAVR